MMHLIQQAIAWWIVFFILGLIAFPFVSFIFKNFFDKGYTLAKVFGLLTVSYIAYVLGTLRLLPFTTPVLIGITLVLFLGSLIFAKKTKQFFAFYAVKKVVLFEEVLFLAALFFWAYIKSFQPDIHGLEKFMDFGFLNSLLRTTYFPTKDMWMAPLSINYYYFGHLMTAVATKLSFLPSNITFNLMLATLFALTFTEGFSLGGNLVYVFLKEKKIAKVIFAGLLTSCLLTFAGNLHTLYTFFTPYQNGSPVPPTSLVFSPLTFPNQYWYPNATRFIYNTIHEFPIYSFVVSDLHGHVLDIPLVLLTLSFFFVFFIKQDLHAKEILANTIGMGFLCAIMYMTNAWDGLIYLGVSALLLIYKTFKKNLLSLTYSLLPLLLSFILVSLPFSLFFKPFASQIGLNCAPQFLINIGHIGPLIFEQGYCQHSPLWQLAILWGGFAFWYISLLVVLHRQQEKNKVLHEVDVFVAGMGFLGFCLIVIPEFVYLKDIYTTYFRANTMFKLVYQSFILLSLVSGYTIIRVSSIKYHVLRISQKILTICYMLFAIVLLTLVFIYPFFAISSYFNNLKNFQGLDGTMYVKNISIDDYNAVKWINKHIKDQPVMLEAQGDSYTDYERISSNTGLPTVFGWMVHEWLWRGTYSIVPPRIADVTNLYESTDLSFTKSLLQTYHVQYVYIGTMEHTKYPKLDEEKFSTLGKIIYSSESVRIYKIIL